MQHLVGRCVRRVLAAYHRCMTWVMRLGPVVASAPMVWGLLAWRSDCADGYDCQPAWVAAAVLVFVVGGLTGLLLVVATGVGRLLARPGRAAIRRPRAVLLAACVALVLATPVRAGWDDGCNLHGGRVAMVEAPRIWLTQPAGFVLIYSGAQTLVRC